MPYTSPIVYKDIDELKVELRIPDDDTSEDAQLTTWIEQASAEVDKAGNLYRGGYGPLDKTFTMDVVHGYNLIDGVLYFPYPIISISSFKLDIDDDGTFGETWSTTNDIDLYPKNGEPKIGVRIKKTSDKSFIAGEDMVQVVAVIGWALIPPPIIVLTTALLTNRYRARMKTPEGIAVGSIETGGITIKNSDPDVGRILADKGMVWASNIV